MCDLCVGRNITPTPFSSFSHFSWNLVSPLRSMCTLRKSARNRKDSRM